MTSPCKATAGRHLVKHKLCREVGTGVCGCDSILYADLSVELHGELQHALFDELDTGLRHTFYNVLYDSLYAGPLAQLSWSWGTNDEED